VYEPAEDTFLLADSIAINEGEKVLDMGTGCGILAVLAAEKAEKVVAVDVNPHAVTCAKKNAELNGVAAKIDARLGNLFDAVAFDEKFDLILFNAPYLPVEEDEGKGLIEVAWDGGRTGRKVIDRFIDNVLEYLAEEGRVLLVQSSLSNVEETLKRFLQHNLHAAIVNKKKVAFEKIVVIEARQRLP
jgi:release factor glutamine methyltransferase